MTWLEFKLAVEAQGVQDDDPIALIRILWATTGREIRVRTDQQGHCIEEVIEDAIP